MKWTLMVLVLIGVFGAPGLTSAVEEEDFMVMTTGDLIELCTAPKSDPFHREAVHFCEGYLVGAYHYHVAEHSGAGENRMVCPPDPPPSRDQAVAMFIEWTKKNPQYLSERPVETWFRFLIEKYPCNR